MTTEFTKAPTVRIPLENGSVIYIETEHASGEEKVGIFHTTSFKEVTGAIEGIADALVATFKKVKPSGASVEFGVDVGIESGHLTTLLVKGTANATLKITLTWGTVETTVPTVGQ
ncbi:MAG TPA: CU044_2847 family protein [Ktedonobacteraceae bacterium]